MEKNSLTNFTYMKHKERGTTIDVPTKDVHRYLKQGFEVVSELDVEKFKDIPQSEGDMFECHLCGEQVSSEKELEVHRATHT